MLGPCWKYKKYGKCGMEMAEIIPHIGSIADDITLIRSMHTGVNNHLPSMYALNTGKQVPGRAHLGAWLSYALGTENQNLPAFVNLIDPRGGPLIGGENWSNGWLPSLYQGTVVRAKEPRILNLDPPPQLKGAPQKKQLDLLRTLNAEHLKQHPGELDLEARIHSYELAARMQTAAKEAFDISRESDKTQRMYGIDNPKSRDYGMRCLIARRLVERGVRFVQIFNPGQSWDHHGGILKALPDRCAEVDQPSAALVKDLKARGLLDSTVVFWGGEMGRLPVIQDDRGRDKVGRDHNTYGFSAWVAGGGFKGGCTYGETDEFGHHAVKDIVTHTDYQLTLLAPVRARRHEARVQTPSPAIHDHGQPAGADCQGAIGLAARGVARNPMRIGHCQIEVKTDFDANLAKVVKFLERAAKDRIEIVCFPECCLSGYSKLPTTFGSVIALPFLMPVANSELATMAAGRIRCDIPSTGLMRFHILDRQEVLP